MSNSKEKKVYIYSEEEIVQLLSDFFYDDL